MSWRSCARFLSVPSSCDAAWRVAPRGRRCRPADIGKSSKGRKGSGQSASAQGRVGKYGGQQARAFCEPRRHRKRLQLQKARIEKPRLIACSIVAQDGHDRMTGAELLGEADGARDVDAARGPDAETFLGDEIEDDAHALFVGDLIRSIDLRAFEV